MVCDVFSVADCVTPWIPHFGAASTSADQGGWAVFSGTGAEAQSNFVNRYFVQHCLRPDWLRGTHAALSALSAVDSAYLNLAAPGIDSFTSPDLPALLIATDFLTAIEGDFWRKLRGMGLAYGYGLAADVRMTAHACYQHHRVVHNRQSLACSPSHCIVARTLLRRSKVM